MRKQAAVLLITILPILLIGQDKSASQNRSFVFRNVTLIDMRSDQPKPNMTVSISGDRIVQIGKNIKIPRNAEVVDASGKFLIPGLWDMHVHTVHPSYLSLFVANGITGIRDMGGNAADTNDGCESTSPLTLMAWRKLILSGDRLGPRMLVSGPAVSNTGWPTSINVKTPEEAKLAVNDLKARGVDFIKVYEKIPLDTYLAIAREARAEGLTIAGHVPVDTVTLLQAANAGHRSIEHVRDHLLMCFTKSRGELLQFFKQDNWSLSDIEWGLKQFKGCPKAISAFRLNNTWLVPTLTVERAKVAVEYSQFVNDKKRLLLPVSVQRGFKDYTTKKLAQSNADRKSENLWWITQKRLVSRMRTAGIKFLAGTDSACEGGLPGFSLHEELRLLVESGFSPLEALQTATINPAKFIRREKDLGTIEKGKLADFILLDANPLSDISNTKKIDGVVVNGRYLSRRVLDEMLSEVDAQAKLQ